MRSNYTAGRHSGSIADMTPEPSEIAVRDAEARLVEAGDTEVVTVDVRLSRSTWTDPARREREIEKAWAILAGIAVKEGLGLLTKPHAQALDGLQAISPFEIEEVRVTLTALARPLAELPEDGGLETLQELGEVEQ